MLLNASSRGADGREALQATEDALKLAPAELQALVRRWLTQAEQSERDRALIVQAAPSFADDLAHVAGAHLKANNAQGAIELCTLALSLTPDNARALNHLGIGLRRVGRAADAEHAYRRAVAVNPDYAEAWLNLANTLVVLGRKDEALISLGRALQRRPDFDAALYARGQLHLAMQTSENAASDFEAVLALKPDHPHALTDLIAARRQFCDWRDHDTLLGKLKADWRLGRRKIAPFEGLLLLDDPADQRLCAAQFVKDHAPAPTLPERPPARAEGKIRLGYLSPDFRDHAVALLASGVFEHHDKARFELHAFSCGPKTDDPVRQRVVAAFDSFTELDGASHHDIAEAMRAQGLDIAIDMGGFTRRGAPLALANRPAPIQASYLGYPGTLGAPFIDYVIADATLIPPQLAQHYAEKIVRLPATYQPNSPRPQSAPTSRAQHGLPAKGVVFCSFNAAAKISPSDFARWMRILRACDDGVLWLQGGATMATNLQREAEAAGITPQRLVFADFQPWEQHLARLALADIVLDTSPYGAHTTASDALWMGVPIITTPGDTFASRVAASLLRAADCADLIAPNENAYVEAAIDLAQAPKQLAALKTKLRTARTSPLFDIAAYTRALERAYEAMLAQSKVGAPRDIDISAD
jgi:predicted O-linked N-acetylglucosamine transferase (SPINDLY family)